MKCLYILVHSLKLTVGYQRFPTNFRIWLSKSDMLEQIYSNGESNDNVPTLIMNGRPISNPYFKFPESTCVVM